LNVSKRGEREAKALRMQRLPPFVSLSSTRVVGDDASYPGSEWPKHSELCQPLLLRKPYVVKDCLQKRQQGMLGRFGSLIERPEEDALRFTGVTRHSDF
jgi:hypothetical protein